MEVLLTPRGKNCSGKKTHKKLMKKKPLILQWFLSLQCANLQIYFYSLVFNMLCSCCDNFFLWTMKRLKNTAVDTSKIFNSIEKIIYKIKIFVFKTEKKNIYEDVLLGDCHAMFQMFSSNKLVSNLLPDFPSKL